MSLLPLVQYSGVVSLLCSVFYCVATAAGADEIAFRFLAAATSEGVRQGIAKLLRCDERSSSCARAARVAQGRPACGSVTRIRGARGRFVATDDDFRPYDLEPQVHVPPAGAARAAHLLVLSAGQGIRGSRVKDPS